MVYLGGAHPSSTCEKCGNADRIRVAVPSRFWFARGSGKLEHNANVKWCWDLYGVSVDVGVEAVEVNRRISIEWPTPVEWIFTPRPDGGTYVRITASGRVGSDDEVAQALDSMGGFSLALEGCKPFLEHGIELNLVMDHSPDTHVEGGA